MERQLLQLGNSKLGTAIHHWALPPIVTCPGKTDVCQANCYATKGRYNFAKVREKLEWNYQQAQTYDFVARMVYEIQSQGVLVLRVHSSGDFFSRGYAYQWLTIMKRCPKVRYYFYTRSWRDRMIEPVLREMAALKCCKAWYSVDDDATVTAPKNVRLAYLQTKPGNIPAVDLVLRVRKLRNTYALPIVCMSETPSGKGTPCGACRRCFS